jgi:FMN phosphatase YigB (HAD superfamily)
MMKECAVYFDLDGVLVDWVAQFEKVSPISLEEMNALSHEERAAFKRKLYNYEFFAEMAPIERGLEMLNRMMVEKPEADFFILSAAGYENQAEVMRAKRDWCAKHLPVGIKEVLLVPKLKHKPAAMKEGYRDHVLIDDRVPAIEYWQEAGGIGVLFV